MSIQNLTYFGHVSNGVLKIHDRKSFDLYVKQFEGKSVEITVQKKKVKRSNEQNSLFHSWCNLLSEYLGYTKDEIKEIIKFKFLKMQDVDEITGEIFEYTKQTSKLTKAEFSDFCNDMQKWCETSFNIRLPLPNENFKLSFIE